MADTCEVRMEKTITALKDSFNAIRTGRASAAIFDKVRVDYYGSKTPLNQVATISIPEARSVIIQPFDKSLIGEIEKAIQVADLGLNPSNVIPSTFKSFKLLFADFCLSILTV